MKIKILKPGVLATVQDLGRPGWRSNGVPLGGAADTTSHRLVNFLAGNKAGAASLEIAGGGFFARTAQAGWLAVACETGQCCIDRQVVEPWRLVFVPEGSDLEIRPGLRGNYCYLAVPGGWDVPDVLGSKSTCMAAGFGGWHGRGLQKGDVLSAAGSTATSDAPADRQPGKIWASPWFVGAPDFAAMDRVIRVLPGPEAYGWSAAQQEQFFKTPFVVSARRDRMGVRLDSDSSGLTFGKPASMLSVAVGPGAVQVPPDGQPVALLADAQTTGGYPRIAQVIAVDVSRLAQIPAGQVIYFQKVTLEEAERLFFEQENMLQKIQLALRWTQHRRTIQ